VQVVYKIDSEKGNYEKELDIKDLYGNDTQVHVLNVSKSRKVDLQYRFSIVFKD
jgi:hypothetical protein